MNLFHDIAQMAKKDLISQGVAVPDDWDDYHVCLCAYELHMRWFDSSVTYCVLYSAELLRKIPTLSSEDQSAIRDIEARLKSGKTLTTYMSRGIKETDMRKSDFLMKNWGFYHLHLEEFVPPKTKYTRPNLLFFMKKGRVVYLVDVIKHPTGSGWFDRNLLEVAYNNWPDLLRFVKGVTPIETIPDSKVHNTLKNSVAFIKFHGGMLFPTNMGVATSGNSIIAVKKTDNLVYTLRSIENELMKRENEIKDQVKNELGKEIHEALEYNLIVEQGVLYAYESKHQLKVSLFPISKLK